MDSYFDSLPDELVIYLLQFMDLCSKEIFTKAYPQFYYLFKEEKRQFLKNNHFLTGQIRKFGIENIVDENRICLRNIIREKRFFIHTFPEIFRRLFLNIDTPVVEYISSLELKNNNHKIFICILEKNKNIIYIRTRGNNIISIWNSARHGEWMCNHQGISLTIVSKYYVNFELIDNILSVI